MHTSIAASTDIYILVPDYSLVGIRHSTKISHVALILMQQRIGIVHNGVNKNNKTNLAVTATSVSSQDYDSFYSMAL